MKVVIVVNFYIKFPKSKNTAIILKKLIKVITL